MPASNDFPARGRIKEIRGDLVVFLPAGTSYELYLKVPQPLDLTLDQPVEGIIRCVSRKLWTVPSGGNFIVPIFGPPRTIQGRVKWLDQRELVVHAGCNFVIQLPESDQAMDLANGPVETGAMVNVMVMPGPTIELRLPAPAR